MKRLARLVPAAALASAVWVTPLFVPIMTSGAMAQDAAVAAATPSAAPADNKALQSAVEDFWHYAKIARYDLAVAELNKVLAHRDKPTMVLAISEQVAAGRKDNLDEWLLRWQKVEPLSESVTQYMAVITEGRQLRRGDQNAIEANIKRLNTNERAYSLAMLQLRQSGEMAVPLLLQYLSDPAQQTYHASVRRALADLGRPALNPLVAATESKNPNVLTQVATVLGDLGYDVATPYLAKLAASDQPGAVKSAANEAMAKLGTNRNGTPDVGIAFLDLAEKFYYGKSSITADNRDPMASVWFWDDTRGLYRKDVPPSIFNELMAMRAAEYALKADPNNGAALSLWLAANYKREVELPQGATDATRYEGQPNAEYYGTNAGVQYLNDALARALRDKNGAVAFKIIRSLEGIAGPANTSVGSIALSDASSAPDKQVRFEAAFAAAGSMPTKPFAGQDRVVPLLAEAVSQNGKPGVVVALPSQDAVNTVVEALNAAGYQAVGVVGGAGVVDASQALPSVDAIVTSEAIGQTGLDAIFAGTSGSPRLERATRVIITETAASPSAQRATSDPLVYAVQSSDPAVLAKAIAAARTKAGGLAMDEKSATAFALRSLDLLKDLAVSNNAVLPVSGAQTTLLAALDDPRAELVKSAGGVLSLLNSKEAQTGLFIKAQDEKTADDVKISLYHSLADSARFHGNLLSPEQITALQLTVEGVKSPEVRNAASTTSGALNLPARQAQQLIVKQSRT